MINLENTRFNREYIINENRKEKGQRHSNRCRSNLLITPQTTLNLLPSLPP